MDGIPSHKQGCDCRLCERIRKSRETGKRQYFHFRTFPELAEKILEKAELSGVTPAKWIEEHLKHALK